MNDGDTLETLLKVRSAFEAESIVALLADAGIEAHVFDIADIGIPLGLNPTAARVPIQVPAGRIEEARKAKERAGWGVASRRCVSLSPPVPHLTLTPSSSVPAHKRTGPTRAPLYNVVTYLCFVFLNRS